MGGSQAASAKEVMGLPVVLRPEAEADLLEARDWYELEASELADAFADSFDAMLVRVKTMPELYAVALKNVRRAKLRRFPTSFITECSQIGSK